MRRVFLEQNLGKKTKARFPRRNPKKTVIKMTIESQKAVSTPSLTQPLVISGVSVMEFCERFNQETINFEEGLRINSMIVVSVATKTYDLDIKTPSVYELMKRIFQQDNLHNISKRTKILSQIIHNIALIKILKLSNNYFKENLLKKMKEIAGNLRSYEEFRVLRKKKEKKKIYYGNLSTVNK